MIRSLLLALALLSLVGCNKPASKDATAPAAGAPAATTAAAAAAPASRASMAAAVVPGEPPLPELGDFRIVSVLMGHGLDAERVVITDTRVFTATDAIHVSVLSIGPHQGLKLSATWIAPDGSIFAKSEQAIVPESDLATTFTVRNPAGWPVGDYELRVALDGHTVRAEKFSVR
jgi:hypothetical protein